MTSAHPVSMPGRRKMQGGRGWINEAMRRGAGAGGARKRSVREGDPDRDGGGGRLAHTYRLIFNHMLMLR